MFFGKFVLAMWVLWGDCKDIRLSGRVLRAGRFRAAGAALSGLDTDLRREKAWFRGVLGRPLAQLAAVFTEDRS